MAIPATRDLKVYQGTDNGTLQFACRDSAGDPFDLTDYTAYFSVSRSYGGTSLGSFAPVVTDEAGGIVQVPLSIAALAALPVERLVYVFGVIDDADEPQAPLVKGAFVVEGVTL